MPESILYGSGYGIHDFHPVTVLIIDIANNLDPVSTAFGDIPSLIKVRYPALIIYGVGI